MEKDQKIKTNLFSYSTNVLPITSYESETLSITHTVEERLGRENNILKVICGPVYYDDILGWRRRYTRAHKSVPCIGHHSVCEATLAW